MKISNIHCQFWSDAKLMGWLLNVPLNASVRLFFFLGGEGKLLLRQLCIYVASNALNRKKEHKDDQQRGRRTAQSTVTFQEALSIRS